MDNLRLLKEPECWCGPNSIAAEPQPFKDIPEDHFQLTAKQSKELQELYDRKAKADDYGVPPSPEFKLKGGPSAFESKQKDFSAALDAHVSQRKRHPEACRPVLEELWKLNNVSQCDQDYGL